MSASDPELPLAERQRRFSIA